LRELDHMTSTPQPAELKRLRILVISNHYPPHEVGGYEQLCRDVTVRLADRGHQVTVLTSDYGTGTVPADGEPDVLRRLRLSPDYSLRVAPWLQFLFDRRRAEAFDLATLKTTIEENQPDVVFIWNLEFLPHSLAVEAEAAQDVGVAYWLAGYSPAGPDLWWRYWAQPPNSRAFLSAPKSVIRAIMLGILRSEGKPVRPRLDHVGVVSAWQLRQGIANGTMPATARVIYNGVELDAFRKPAPEQISGPLRLLIAGRVSADKGVHLAVEAVGRLAQEPELPEIQLIVAGSGPERYLSQLKDLAAQHKIAERTKFMGWLPRQQMPDLMASCHVLLLPTIHQEPFARVVLEALASGLAVIGADTGGTAEIIRHEETGLIVRADDAADLAAQIRRLATDDALRRRIATEGQREVLDKFSIDRMVDHLEILLAEASADLQQAGATST